MDLRHALRQSSLPLAKPVAVERYEQETGCDARRQQRVCADRLAGSFNPQLASSASSPVPVALERHVIRAVARRAAFGDDATGHFATGGSEANYTALICALTAAHPKFSEGGARAFTGPVGLYTSQDCHIAWLKFRVVC